MAAPSSIVTRLLLQFCVVATISLTVLVAEMWYFTRYDADGVTHRRLLSDESAMMRENISADWRRRAIVAANAVGRFVATTPRADADGPMDGLLRASGPLRAHLAMSLQQSTMRIFALAATWPLAVAFGGAAFAQGIVARARRRAHASPESAFLFELAKKNLLAAPALALFIYSIGPFPAAWFRPLVLGAWITAAVAVYVCSAFFKKHL